MSLAPPDDPYAPPAHTGSVAPYHPPPAYPPPVNPLSVSTDGNAAASVAFGILALLFGLPLGLPGLIAGPIAYFLGRGARERIAASNGALRGAGAANAGRILGVIATAVGAAVTLVWFVLILIALNDVPADSGF